MRDEYLVNIYKGLLENKSAKQIHSELYKRTINREHKSEKAYEIAVKTTNRLKKVLPNKDIAVEVAKRKHPKYAKDINTTIDAFAVLIIGFLTHFKTEQDITKAFNEKRYEWENVAKEEAIVEDIEHNRNLNIPKIFYICSKHNDCALDHLKLQGRIYIDAEWEKYVDETLKDKVRDYTTRNNTITIQEATSRPYWLITRPHCRHYFKAIDTKQVLKKSVKRLLRKYNMSRKIGDRQYLQTMDSGVGTMKRKLLGEYRNAQLMTDKYNDRLAMHKKLYKAYPSPILKDAINKDKLLIDKWKKYMKEIEKRGGV